MSKRKPATEKRWRCLECGADGIGGTAGWTAHWISEHNTPPF